MKIKLRYLFSEERTYINTAENGGLELTIARGIVEERKAKNPLLLSLSGLQSEDTVRTIVDLRRAGARVEAPKCDITNFPLILTVLGGI